MAIAQDPIPASRASHEHAPGVARRLLRAAVSEYATFLLSAVYFLVVWPLLPELATSRNLSNLFTNMLPLLAAALGQTVVMIAGGIDLSVTAVIAAASVAAARTMTQASNGGGFSPRPAMVPAAIALALLLGITVGAVNGVAVAGLSLPPFIVTLGTMMILAGVTLWSTHSNNIANLPDSFAEIGYGSFAGVPHVVWIVASLALAVHLLLTRTLLGRWLYAAGHNPRAALISGVPVRRVTASAYAISGLCAAVASILYTARLETGSPTLGREILLDVIGATVIGGTSLFGGKGKVVWTVFGVLLFTLVANTLNLLGLQHYTIMVIKGVVILIAAALDLLRNRLAAGA